MTVIQPDLADWRERQYVPQYSMPPLQLQIHVAGQVADPDGQAVTAQLLLQNKVGTVAPVNSYTAAWLGTGLYQVVPSSADTSRPSDAELVWAYSISGAPQQYAGLLVIGYANPAYDNLPASMQELVEFVWIRFADLIDSPAGGPNIIATPYFQAHWSRGRVSQLMTIALGKINAIGQPWSSYTVDGVGGALFPVQLWGGLLGTYTYVECVKHLIRSYVEQPAVVGSGSITRLERRDYAERWRAVLRDEEAELKSLLDVFKIRHMGLGNPRVLVSGGTYGRYAPTRIAGSVAARPRMWARWKRGTNRSCAEPQHGSTTMKYACPHDRSKSRGQARPHTTVRGQGEVRAQRRPFRRSCCLPSLDRLDRSQHRLRPAQLAGPRR